MKTPLKKHLKGYRPPSYLVDKINLDFDIQDDYTTVSSKLEIKRSTEVQEAVTPLFLDGRNLELISIELDGNSLAAADYELTEDGISIKTDKKEFVLEIKTRIFPDKNTSLEGLYKAGNSFLTQCEAEGFRRITFFPDRPDVMSRYTVSITADKKKCPVLLSNGDVVSAENIENGRHRMSFEDPFPKPCYLFALVAGDLACVEDSFVTKEGRSVNIKFYVDHGDEDKCTHAVESLKKSMAWDEKNFGLSYDLSTYVVVSTHSFNAGAMENKGLNIFNSKYVLARPETATDADFQSIENVIGHEYFHNWTGNRVTLNSWFQLSLKEGLTVFRDQEFSSDSGSRAIKRIEDVKTLRASQFIEDSGSMAHPVRPESYIEMNNFYTSTVYNKGAEVIRMIHTIIGKEKFRKGMDLYFQRFDGKAVTTEDFVKTMEDAGEIDLSQFRLWYSQAGTPEVNVERIYDPLKNTYTLVFEQSIPDTPGQTGKLPMMIPVSLSLFNKNTDIKTDSRNNEEQLLILTDKKDVFTFENWNSEPVPSIFRGFSAPVKVNAGYTREELIFLMANDTDPFNRWQASQNIVMQTLSDLIETHRTDRNMAMEDRKDLIDALGRTLEDTESDKALISLVFTLPSENDIIMNTPAPDYEAYDDYMEAVCNSRLFLVKSIGKNLYEKFVKIFNDNSEKSPYSIDSASIARRSLKNTALFYLLNAEDSNIDLVYREFSSADNMTDKLFALRILADVDHKLTDRALLEFYDEWKNDPLVMDKWFAVLAASRRKNTIERVAELTAHPLFSLKNPNKVRSLIGTVANANPMAFHNKDGSGYAFVADRIIEIDKINESIAARLATAFNTWKKYDNNRKNLMKKELIRISETNGLSKGVFEIVSNALADQ